MTVTLPAPQNPAHNFKFWLLSPLYRYYLLKVCKITEWHFLVISTEFLKVWTTRKKNCLKKNIIAEQHQIPWQTNLWQGEKLEKLFKSPRCLSLQLNYFALSSWGRNLHLDHCVVFVDWCLPNDSMSKLTYYRILDVEQTFSLKCPWNTITIDILIQCWIAQ